ncbi:gala protein [Streptomyces thermocarboxydus]
MPATAASPHARHVLLGTNAIGDEGALTVARALAEGHGLRTLYLGCNRIGPDGVTALADALSADGTVRALWLKRNPVGDDGVTALAAMLRRNTTLRTLDLVNTGATTASLRLLLDALTGRPHPVERLFLGGNGLTADSAELLAAFVRDAGVRELYLPANHLGDRGAAVLAAAAAGSAHPVRLGLGGNGIGPAGARALADALGGIEALDLGRPMSERSLGAPANATGDDGAHALASALPGSPCAGWSCATPASPDAARSPPGGCPGRLPAGVRRPGPRPAPQGEALLHPASAAHDRRPPRPARDRSVYR